MILACQRALPSPRRFSGRYIATMAAPVSPQGPAAQGGRFDQGTCVVGPPAFSSVHAARAHMLPACCMAHGRLQGARVMRISCLCALPPTVGEGVMRARSPATHGMLHAVRKVPDHNCSCKPACMNGRPDTILFRDDRPSAWPAAPTGQHHQAAAVESRLCQRRAACGPMLSSKHTLVACPH